MSLQDQLTAAQAVVTDIQAQIDAAAPHLSKLQEIENAVTGFGGRVEECIKAAIDSLRAEFGF